MIVRALFSLSSVLILVTAAACGQMPGRAERDTDQYFQNFVKLAERANEEGFTAYWLGRSFEAGGLTFEGPGVADFGADVTGGGIDMSYAARVQGGGTVPLNITLYTPEAWLYAENEICESGRCQTQSRDPSTRETVRLLDRDAELLLIAGGARPVNVAVVIVDLGDTMVVAKAHATSSTVGGGPDPNPLIDPKELLRVMEGLRPYPE